MIADADEEGLVRCCSSGTKYSTDAIHSSMGKCCPTGTSYTFDTTARMGECCPTGQVFVEAACRTLGPLAVSSPPILPMDSGCAGCGNGAVCSANGHLGIQYGHCYTMTDSNGRQIQRDEGYFYRQSSPSNDNNAFIGLVFRVCNSTADCTQKQDQFVPERGNWFQLDQYGWRDGTSPGWVIFTNTWVLSMSTTWNYGGFPPANFTGKGSCFFGKCAISLQFGISDATAMTGMASYGGGLLSRCNNPNSWKPYYYEEVPCEKEINAWPPKS